MRDADIQALIRIALNPYGKFFRINTGTGWTGKESVRINRNGQYYLQEGDVVIKCARPFSTGTPKGFSDLIGAAKTIVTPAMVGTTIAIFSAIEIKTEIGRVSEDQKNFIKVIQSVGGYAGIARSVDDAVYIVRGDRSNAPFSR